MKIVCVSFALVMLFAACDQRDFYAVKSFDSECWALADTFTFSYDNPGPETRPLLNLEVDVLEAYEFRNLHLQIIATSPSGKKNDALVQDILQDEAGNWRVESSRGVYPIAFTQQADLSFSETGTYQIQVVQFMRKDTLCEIRQVGVSLN